MTDSVGPPCTVCGELVPPGQTICGACGSSSLEACPTCAFGNPRGQRFCGGCGGQLPIACPSCGTSSPAGQRFCGNCGSPLTAIAPAATAVPAPAVRTSSPVVEAPTPLVTPMTEPTPSVVEEERRIITAIFCDLVGFTPLSEALDPEEVREIQTLYFGQMNRELHRFGGSVEKYAGDAVLALFGAPIAHEDDAERAVRCALAMQQAFQPVAAMAKTEWNVDLAVRIGVNTGEAISGAWDVEGHRNYSATGDVVNTAARLQSSADPGGVIVGPETMHLARRAILFGPRRDLTLKGKATTFPAYPVIGLREQIAERWETHQQSTPLIGRETEMAQVMEAWEQVQSGVGRVLTVVADAGVGKSRLLTEAVERMSVVAGTVVLRGRCLSYGEGMSHHLVADIVRHICQVHEGDSQERILAGVRTTVDALLAPWDLETRDAAVDVLGGVLGLPADLSDSANADPQVRRQTLVRSLQLLLSALSSYRPAILLLEDLHWADAASCDVLVEVLPAIGDCQAMVLATHRRGWRSPWATWPNAKTLTLEPLDDAHALDLARAILGRIGLEPELEQLVTERAGGNPFFIEEFLHSLQEADTLEERDGRIGVLPGVVDKLPSSLTELLLARLDQLDRTTRATAQYGSVIGRTFDIPLLTRIAEQGVDQLSESLETLEQAEIAFPRNNDGHEYIFKHATVREVAYNTLLLRRRQALHAATARAMIVLSESDENVEVIAYHFSRSREHADAAEWLERSADRAASIYANDAAIEQYQQAGERLEKIGAQPLARAQVYRKLGCALKIMSRHDEALAVLEESAAAFHTVEDIESERHLVAEIGRVHRARGTPDEGITRVTAMLDVTVEDGAASSGVAALHVALARLYFNVGRYEEQRETAQIGSELAARASDQRVLAEAEMSRGISLFLLGQTENALEVMQAAVPVAEEVGDFEVLNILLGNLALIYRDMGDFERSREYRERSAQVTEQMGDMANHSFALASLGELWFFLGDWAAAEEHLDRAMRLIRSLSTSWFSSIPPIVLGQLYTARGDFSSALDCLGEALAVAQKGGHRHSVRRILDSLAEIDLIMGDPTAALARFDGIVDLSALDENDNSHTATLPVVAWAHLADGDSAGALSLATLGMQRAEREQAIVELLAAQRVGAMAMAAQGNHDGAMRLFEQTIALATQMPYPYALARALYEQGLILNEAGNTVRAAVCLRKAQGLFQHLGAKRYVELATHALATLSTIRL